MTLREASTSHKLSPVRSEEYIHPRTQRVFQRPHATPPFCSSTYVSIRATCPSSCPMRDAGCYAQSGFTARGIELLDRAADGLTGLQVIEGEARAIRAAFGGGRIPRDGARTADGRRRGRDLRLHVAGDVPDEGVESAVTALASAARQWRIRGGGTVWTYTHQWRRVPRSAWGAVRVLASCDRPEEIEQARARGYSAALVVAEFPGPRAFAIPGIRGRVVPCPAQTRGVTCVECRLCLDHDLLKLDIVIGFAAHGRGAGAIRERVWQPEPERTPARRSPRLVVMGGGA